MGARSGESYKDSLKRNQPEVWLNGGRVTDVTEEPIFAGPIATIAEQYDLQLDPRYTDLRRPVDIRRRF